MEVCGTHTAAVFKNGIRSFLSQKIKLVSGPGCPVCVTVVPFIDECIDISLRPGHELICFGDLMKVPGSEKTLSDAKGSGGRVRMTWSPFDTIELALAEPETTFVFAAIGFETTAPAYALMLEEIEQKQIRNIKLLTSIKSTLTAIDWICAAGESVDAFLCPGHVSVITGADAYIPLAEKYRKPFIIAGFEGGHLLSAIRTAVEAAADVCGDVQNLYPEAVSAKGNARAKAMMEQYFDVCNEVWRGLGVIAASGYKPKEKYSLYNFPTRDPNSREGLTEDDPPGGCRCGDVILGRIDPDECPLFGTQCTPVRTIGPCMVSSEGTCGTWYRARI